MSDAVRGQVVVRARAFRAVFSALAAETLGVRAGDVAVRIGDERGAIGVDIRAAYASQGSDVVQTAKRVQDAVRTRGHDLTGAQIGSVSVRITDVVPSTGRSLA